VSDESALSGASVIAPPRSSFDAASLSQPVDPTMLDFFGLPSAEIPSLEAAAGPLRRALLEAADEAGCSMNDLTVLSVQNDPYRVDTPAGHRDGTSKRLRGRWPQNQA